MGNHSNNFKDITGLKFNRWLVISYARKRKHVVYWNCVCDCGIKRIVAGSAIKTGSSKSCGCLRIEVSKTVGLRHGRYLAYNTFDSIYNAWAKMKGRCYNEKDNRYKNYGARGIKVCERWLDSHENFREDMGPKPSKEHSLDRKDNDANYSCGKCDECITNGWIFNCHWATQDDQNKNKTDNVWIEYDGRKQIIRDWGRELGIPGGFITTYLKRGWTFDEIYKNFAA